MTKRIIIAADEEIVCPKCDQHFPLSEGITRQTIERYESEFDEVFAAQKKELEVTLEKEAERKATKHFAEQIALLEEKLQDSKLAEEEAKQLIVKAQIDAKAKAQHAFENEKKALVEVLKSESSLQRQLYASETADAWNALNDGDRERA